MKTINALKAYIKKWNKIISFDMRKRVKCKTFHDKNEEKGKLEVLGVNP